MKKKKSLESLKDSQKFGTVRSGEDRSLKGGGDTFSHTIIIVLAAVDVEVEIIDIYY